MPTLPKIDRKRKKELKQLEKNLGVRFRKIQFLEWALQHRSYVNEYPEKKLINNEQLEFLGDSILGHVIAQTLFEKFPQFSEGKLSMLKSSLVNKEMLEKCALKYKIGDFLLLGKGEEKGGGRKRASILADSFEAVIAVLYLDRGFKGVSKFLNASFDDFIQKTLKSGPALDNAKNRLQKMTQSRYGLLPEYRLSAESGPEHKKTFHVRVFVKGKESGEGFGKTKKKAEETAAQEALKNFKRH